MQSFLKNLAKDAFQDLFYRGKFLWRLPAAAQASALTFDDGPHPIYTLEMLDMLAHTGVRASFFLVGREVDKYPHIVRRIVEEGHAVAGHSYEHTVMPSLSTVELQADLKRCRQSIAAACGVDTWLFRPPKGEVSLRSIRTVCRGGYNLVHWSKTFSDYRKDSTPALSQRIAELPVVDRDILLFHDNNPFTVEALALAIPRWLEAGRRFKAL